MQRWRKASFLRLWIWIMLVVMPLSGLAASAAPCLGGHAPARSLGLDEASTSPCHGGATMAAPADSSFSPEAAPAAGDAGHHCSACAACVVSAALPVTLPAMGAPGPALAEAPPPLLRGKGLFVGGLERPPRAAR